MVLSYPSSSVRSLYIWNQGSSCLIYWQLGSKYIGNERKMRVCSPASFFGTSSMPFVVANLGKGLKTQTSERRVCAIGDRRRRRTRKLAFSGMTFRCSPFLAKNVQHFSVSLLHSVFGSWFFFVKNFEEMNPLWQNAPALKLKSLQYTNKNVAKMTCRYLQCQSLNPEVLKTEQKKKHLLSSLTAREGRPPAKDPAPTTQNTQNYIQTYIQNRADTYPQAYT